jgi:hypothetical protein
VASDAPRRTFSAIVAAAEELRLKRKERERREAERARLVKLEALAKRQEQVWAQVPELLARRTASGYDEAVELLARLLLVGAACDQILHQVTIQLVPACDDSCALFSL